MTARQAALFCPHGGDGCRLRGSRAERAVIFQNTLVPLNCKKNCSTERKKTDGGMKDAVWRVKEEEEKKKGRDGNVEKEGKVSGSDRSERSRQRRMEDVLHLRETGF